MLHHRCKKQKSHRRCKWIPPICATPQVQEARAPPQVQVVFPMCATLQVQEAEMIAAGIKRSNEALTQELQATKQACERLEGLVSETLMLVPAHAFVKGLGHEMVAVVPADAFVKGVGHEKVAAVPECAFVDSLVHEQLASVSAHAFVLVPAHAFVLVHEPLASVPAHAFVLVHGQGLSVGFRGLKVRKQWLGMKQASLCGGTVQGIGF